MSIKKLADDTNIPYSTLQRYFSGETDLSSDRFIALLNKFNIDLLAYINACISDKNNESYPKYISKSLSKIFGDVGGL
jgi:transcriptional regulator with XRE-family HTH domain